MLGNKSIKKLRVRPGGKLHLKNIETDWCHEIAFQATENDLKDEAKRLLKKNVQDLETAQELLYASDSKAVLIVLQGMDAAGKDGTIKHVMSGVNPQGCSVHGFKQPSVQELGHAFLWRYSLAAPERGHIAIFNRSYYEDVVAARVHPEWIAKQHLKIKNDDKFWQSRYDDINAFEQHLTRNGTVILKFFLHISKDEQRRRLLARLDDTEKLWKFSASDLRERGFWKEYRHAYEKAIAATSTEWAPWYVIPADFKWAARTLVAEVIAHTISSLKLAYPPVDAAMKKQAAAARAALK